MIRATATDFKANLGMYLTLISSEDVLITKNGKEIALLTTPKTETNWVDDLTGIVSSSDLNEKQFKGERLAQKYESLD